MNNFHVGQKVVCVASFNEEFESPLRGHEYTVSDIFAHRGEEYLALDEIDRSKRGHGFIPVFAASGFESLKGRLQ